MTWGKEILLFSCAKCPSILCSEIKTYLFVFFLSFLFFSSVPVSHPAQICERPRRREQTAIGYRQAADQTLSHGDHQQRQQ